MQESSSLRWIAFVRPAVGLFAFVHKKIDLKKMFMILTILASVAEEESHSKYPCRRSCLFLLDTKTFWQACNLHYPRFGLGSREVARKRCIQVHSWRRKECCEICGRDHCSKQRRAEVFLGDLRKGDTFYP